MTLNLHIYTPHTETADSLRAYLLTQPHYRRQDKEDVAYINQATGVYFLVEMLEAPSNFKGTETTLGLCFVVALGHAEFFGLEAFPEIERICKERDLLLRSEDSRAAKRLTAKQLHAAWLPHNDRALSDRAAYPDEAAPLASSLRSQTNDLWRYCVRREALQAELGKGIAVLDPQYYRSEEGKLVTVAPLIAGTPAIMPRHLDYVFYIEPTKALGFIPSVKPKGYIRFERVREVLGTALRDRDGISHEISAHDASAAGDILSALSIDLGPKEVTGESILAERIIDIEPLPDSNHAVIITIKLSDDAFGTEDERDKVYELEDTLEAILSEQDEVDGHDFGGGEASIYLYGPDADALYKVTQPVLRRTSFKAMTALLRYGSTDQEDAEEKTITIY
jgi:hypothetical protein